MKAIMTSKQKNTINIYVGYFLRFYDFLLYWQDDVLNVVDDFIYQDIVEDLYLYEIQTDTKQLITLNFKTMTMIEMFLKEMEEEAKTTRKMLEPVPEDKYDWKPHAKSMTIQRLANHIAELPSWTKMALETDELDFNAGTYVPKLMKNNKELMDYFEKNLKEGRNSLKQAKDNILPKIWVFRNGDTIFSKRTKAEVIRMSFCQTVHHRAQLGVFLRLLDIPIPGSYGPSADEQNF